MADELREALAAIHKWKPDDESANPLPEWLLKLFGEIADFRIRDIAQHPGGGILLCAKRQNAAADETDYFADEDDAPSEAPEEVPLAGHCAQVAAIAEKLARACVGEPVARIAQAAANRLQNLLVKPVRVNRRISSVKPLVCPMTSGMRCCPRN